MSPASFGFQSHHAHGGSVASPLSSGQYGQQLFIPNGSQYPQMHGPSPSTILNAGNNNPLTMYLNQISVQQNQSQQRSQEVPSIGSIAEDQLQSLSGQQSGFFGGGMGGGDSARNSPFGQQSQPQHPSHSSSNSFSVNGITSGMTTVGGLLAPSNLNSRAQHARAVSLPVFPQGPLGQHFLQSQQQQQQQHPFGSFSSGRSGFGANGYGLAIHEEEIVQ